jgi:glutamate synthase domain-containing protein 2/glutamate synthase domain-containing protein 3
MLGSVGFDRLERELAQRESVESPGYVKFRKGGEPHANDPDTIAAAHALRVGVAKERRDLYEKFAALVDGRTPLEPRDLLELAASGPPVPLDEVEPAEAILARFSGGAMSHGSLSAEAHETIAIALNRLGARSNSGEGGEDAARTGTERASAIRQIASARFGVTPGYAAGAAELQIKIAQGSKPGEGGQLPAHKVTAEIAALRHTEPGIPLISPPPHHDIYSIEDLAQLVFDLRQVNPRAEISVKLVASAGVGTVAVGVAKALADTIHIAGMDGGTGASPLSSIKNVGLPWEIGLADAHTELVAAGLRDRVRLRVDGGLKTGRDILVAASLGADEFSFGTALLIAEGCLLVRSCHLDTCPVGIATQRPELRAKFAATPEMVEWYLREVAEDVRRGLAALGLRSLGDFSRRVSTFVPRAPGGALGERLARDAEPALAEAYIVDVAYPISTHDRAVGARLGGIVGDRTPPGRVRAHFTGSAGQSFGAFLAHGIELALTGEANDGVGKSMGGGRIVVKPPPADLGDPVLLGNAALYGATGGELYCAGAAGERFAVRNSGARAVVEGAGDHLCEYMTAGEVLVLGPIGANACAGMTGGVLHVLGDVELNSEHVELLEPDYPAIRALLERHHRFTGSTRGLDAPRAAFRTIVPKAALVIRRASVE